MPQFEQTNAGLLNWHRRSLILLLVSEFIPDSPLTNYNPSFLHKNLTISPTPFFKPCCELSFVFRNKFKSQLHSRFGAGYFAVDERHVFPKLLNAIFVFLTYSDCGQSGHNIYL